MQHIFLHTLEICFIFHHVNVFIYLTLPIRIYVNMDDNIVEHYTNQSAFLIEMSEVVTGQFQVTLTEV